MISINEEQEERIEKGRWKPPSWVVIPAIAGAGATLTAKKIGDAVDAAHPVEVGKKAVKGIGKFVRDNMTPSSLREAVSLALFYEMTKANIKTAKMKAGMRALNTGNKRLQFDPKDRIGRAFVDGGNRLAFSALGKKPPMRTM